MAGAVGCRLGEESVDRRCYFVDVDRGLERTDDILVRGCPPPAWGAAFALVSSSTKDQGHPRCSFGLWRSRLGAVSQAVE